MRIEQSLDFELNYYLRRHQTAGESYRDPITPYPGECLADLLIRAACENGFAPSMSDKLLGLPHSITRLAPDRNTYGVTPEALAILLGNPGGPEQLAPLLHNDLPTRKDLRPFFDTWLNKKAFSKARRVSPRALRKAPFLRAIWRIRPVGFDPETKELLIKDCPVCHKRLSAKFMGDVWCCDRCAELNDEGELLAVDLREHEQSLVAEHHWENLDFATCFIDPTALDHRRIQRSRLHADFNDVGDGEVFELICSIARALPGCSPPGTEFPAENLATAGRIVRGWPDTFEEHYASVAADDNPKRCNVVYNNRLNAGIRVRAAEILRAAKLRPLLAELPDEDATASEYEFKAIKSWILRGALGESSKENTEAVVLRARPDIRMVSEKLGISIPSFMSMCDDELFPSQPTGDGARSKLPAFANRLAKNILEKSQNSKMPKNAIRLPRAVSSLFLRGDDPWRAVVIGMLSGLIRYWKTDLCGRSLLEKVYIDDLDDLRQVLADTPQTAGALRQVPLSGIEASRILRIRELGLAAAIKAGLLSPPLTAKSIARFQSEFEPSNLLSVRYIPCERRKMTAPMLRSLADAGITPLALKRDDVTLVWRREDVERHFGADLIPCVR